MKIAHEAPKSIFSDVQSLTDYDHFLVHLFEEDPEYLQLAEKAVAEGREVILDNSIFELGEAFDMQKFAEWVNRLKPTWYIVPDSLDNTKETISNMEKWCKSYRDRIDSSCKMIGVIQGSTYEEVKECYTYMDKVANVDKIAFSFDSEYYNNSVPHSNKLVSWMMGRVKMLGDLQRDEVINVNKPHHLLGAGLISEFQFYDDENYSWIDSVDTSSPVVHGMVGLSYDEVAGNFEKASVKLYTLIDAKLNSQERERVKKNVEIFRHFCNDRWYI